MADSTIGNLPAATSFTDASLLVTEQYGSAKKLTGLLLKTFCQEAVDAKKGWTSEQIDLLEEAVDLLRLLSEWVMMIGDPEHPGENPGYTLAGALCNKLDELVANLRGEQPTGITYEMRQDGALRITAAPAGSYTITADDSLKIL